MELFEFPRVEVTSEATLNYHQENNIIELFKFPKVRAYQWGRFKEAQTDALLNMNWQL